MISLASVKPQQIARLVVTIPQFKRDFQLDNNTGDDIHATLARYHIGLELVRRSDKIVGAENLTFWCPVGKLIPKSVIFKKMAKNGSKMAQTA